MGKYVVKLMTELQYYGTLLPRIPVPIERKIKMRVSQLTQLSRHCLSG
jgi:hypothetical protein